MGIPRPLAQSSIILAMLERIEVEAIARGRPSIDIMSLRQNKVQVQQEVKSGGGIEKQSGAEMKSK